MSVFKIVGEQIENHARKEFWFDNISGKITEMQPEFKTPITEIDITEPGRKSGPFSRIKVQLGLSCNYSCSYCSQRKHERAPETSPKDIEAFLTMFDALPKVEHPRIEFWGGEPLVYIKTLKPLAEAIRQRYPTAQFSTVTNGSLITKEFVDWLVEVGFGIAMSHDGPGQHMRGDDPLIDNAEAIDYAVDRLLPLGRFSISSMLNAENPSRLKIIEYFEQRFPDLFIPSSEMGFVDVYNAESADSVRFSTRDHFNARRNLWAELRFSSKVRAHCFGQSQSIDNIAIVNLDPDANPLHQPGQKCGMERKDTIALDLRGNILTCQNTSAVAISDNGEPHKIGHVSELASTALKTSMHWTERDSCATCPVLQLCRGSCMFLRGENFDLSCAASYTDHIAQLAIAFEQATGYVPIWVETIGGKQLPPERQDVWGSLLDWSKIPEKTKRKVIPIAAK